MEYQNIINLLEYITKQPSEFRTKNPAEISDVARGMITKIVKLNLKLQSQV